MARGRPMVNSASRGHRSRSGPHSFLSSSPLAEQALARDLAACSDGDVEEAVDDDHFLDPVTSAGHGFSHGHGMYRRPSGVAYGASRPVFNSQPMDAPFLTALERKQSRDAERSLLRDNHVLPPKHRVQKKSRSLMARIYRRFFSTKLPRSDGEQSIAEGLPTETSPLLNGNADDVSALTHSPSCPGDELLEEQWEEAIASGRLRTSWQRETKTLMGYSAPLIATFILQYSINVASIFVVGRIGTIELAAVSLANMTSAITCMAPFQGLATSLDTLCAQAYGSGHKHLVGLQCQRMACFLTFLSVPVIVLWLFADRFIVHIVPDAETARLAALYLKVMVFAIPGIIFFESGKRFLQAQGLFRGTTYVLLVAAPFNVFINWLLVWKLGLGFIGAPIAIALTESLLPVLLVLYVRFVDGSQCWGGFSRRAFSNWWVMVRLALPGMIMVEAEWLAFEITTILSGRFGSEYLAAQSVLATLTTTSYQIPFPMSIAASTRIANLIGAGLVDAAKTTARVTFAAALIIGLFNLVLYSTLRYHLPLLFTRDAKVVALVANVLPLVAVMQVFDGLSAGAHGILRGIGKQSIGGPANLISYYVVSLPISLALAFGLGWRLEGLWLGVTVGLVVVSLIEYIYLVKTDWHEAAAEAAARNAAG